MKRTQLASMMIAACAALAGGCGSSPPVPQAPSAAPASQTEEAALVLVYSKHTDPLYLVLDGERNVFGRRTLARLWVVAAQNDPPSDAQVERLAEASRAKAQAEEAAGAESDACNAGVRVAMDRASRTKMQLERRYLSALEQYGESSFEARSLDAQVHFLRDETEELRVLSEPCPPVLFEGQLPEPTWSM